MKRTKVILSIFASFLVAALLAGGVAAETSEAWSALGNLDTERAKRLFEEELEKSPGDFEVLRGLFLCACFDLDPAMQDRLVRDMVEAEPSNPYLLSLFEHVILEMSSWKDYLKLSELIGEALERQEDPRLRHTGMRMQTSVDSHRNRRQGRDFMEKSGSAPGYWVAGPFENQSNIAAYRSLPFEGAELDTAETVVGKEGQKVGWTWLKASSGGDLWPGEAYGSTSDFACQVRCFFELPSEMEVLVLPGGACSMRILLDGEKVYADPKYRNAVQREGFRVRLGQGPHEITAVLGSAENEVAFDVAVLAGDYRPIRGLKWPRFAAAPDREAVQVERIHTIFNPFDEYVESMGTQVDTPYWTALLRNHNGYEDESVKQLEKAEADGGLSLLGKWALHRSLLQNNEEAMAIEQLGDIKESASTAMTDYLWIEATVDDREAQIRAYEELNRIYPDRLPIELGVSVKVLVDGDYVGFLEGLDSLKKKYPGSSSPYEIRSLIYQ